jgi:DNA end-binding protein Ku
MRSMWKGSLSFGLVNLPVRLFSAIEDSSLDLDMLDKKDMSHIHFQRVNENTGREVEWENIVKAYKYKGDYVVLSEEDFEQASAVKTRTIEILNFVDEDEIDTIYYEQPYYIEPEKGGTKAYVLLREALKKAGKVGVTSFVMRSREYLAVIKPHDTALVLNRIRFQEEIRDYNMLKLPGAISVSARELDVALELIEHYTEPFDIAEYRDTYTAELMKIIKAKAQGKKPKAAKLELVYTKSKDLMEQLKASLEKKRKAS